MHEETLTREELEKLLARALRLDSLEKMGIYHGLVEMLKSAADPREAANNILMEIDSLFHVKADQVREKVENKIEAKSNPGGGRMSPIFRRVGR